MRKIYKIFLLILLFVFMFSINVYAKIPYQELNLKVAYKYVDSNREYVFYHGGTDGTPTYTVYFEDIESFWVCSSKNITVYGERYTSNQINLDYAANPVSLKSLTNSDGYDWGYNLFYHEPMNNKYELAYTDWNMDFVYASKEDFFKHLCDYGSLDDFIKNSKNDSSDNNKLPMLHYKMSSKNVISFPNIIDKKISIDWDFSSVEPYASDPMSYALEIIISANFYPNTEGQKICWDASNSGINNDCKRVLSASRSLLEKPYTFIYLKEGDALYTSSNHIFATDELQDGYYLYIRSYSKDGTKSSNYKVYKCTTGGTSGQMDLTYDTEGNSYALDDDDRDDNSDYSNEYDENSSSSADEDPTGDSYDGNGGYSFDTLYGNLNSMVNMLQGVPELWVYVMSWLPSWFPTFIVTMMGLLIVIGVLKYIF